MTDIARMRFQSALNPDETGTIALAADGTVRIEPNEAMLEKVAALEQQAVERAARNSAVAATVLIGLGLTAAALGWAAGRIGGRLRERMTDARDVKDTELSYEAKYGMQLRFKEGPLRSASFSWLPGEYNADEAEHLYETFKTLRSMPESGRE